MVKVVSFILLITVTAFADNDSPVVTQHLGRQLPLDLTFTDSNGKQVLLKDLVNKPTVFDFVYYNCAGICTPV